GLADVLDALGPPRIDDHANDENNGNNANKEPEDDSTLPERWATGDEAAIAKVDGVLTSAGLTIDAVMAQTLSNRIDIVERVERMRVRKARQALYAGTPAADELARQLARLDDFERRALSHRKFAVRHFDSGRIEEGR